MQSRNAYDANSLNKLKNNNDFCLCSYCTKVHTLTLQCPVVTFCGVSCNIQKFNAVPHSALLSFFGSQHKGAIIPLRSVTLSGFTADVQCLLTCTNSIFEYNSG
jgi:hypothetical protein